MSKSKQNKNLKKKNAIISGEAKTGYISLPQEKRFSVLFHFMKKNYSKKVIIYTTSPSCVQLCEEFMLNEGLSVLTIHEKQSESTQKETLQQFINAKSSILVCTDKSVKSFEDVNVNFMVQYDPPHDLSEYINRLKRMTSNKTCECLLFTTEEEIEFIRYLKSQGVKVELIDVLWTKLDFIQVKLEKLVKEKYAIYLSARHGYTDYLRAYRDHSNKEIFSLSNLNVTKVANNFGFKVAPFFELDPPSQTNDEENKKRRRDENAKSKIFRKKIVYKRIKKF